MSVNWLCCVFVSYFYIIFYNFIFIFFRAAVSAFKPFCPAHIVLRNIYINVLCIVSNK